MQKSSIKFSFSKSSVSVLVEDIAIGARGLGIKSREGEIGHSDARGSQTRRFSFRAVLPNAQELGRANGSRHSLHASAKYREYNEDLISKIL